MNLTTVLVKRGLISAASVHMQPPEDASSIRAIAEQHGLREEDAMLAYADEFGMQFVDLNHFVVDRERLNCFPSSELFRRNVLPIGSSGHVIQIATSNPLDLEGLDELSSLSGFPLDAVLASELQIARHLKEALGVGGGTVRELVARSNDIEVVDGGEQDDSDIDDESQASSVVKLVNELLLEAIQQRASDIHIEPEEDGLDIRYRVDGVLRAQSMPPELHRFRAAIVSRLKIMAQLNIAEKRLPQDGRIKLVVGGRDVDVRVSVIPMLHGEGVVMRLLDKSRSNFNLKSVELSPEQAASWNKLIRKPHGMVLVTGPTGSGKTTTLYSSLAEINSRGTKIITVEDPVEYQLKGISQIQVQSKIGLTFAAGLRSILRHDPDVILIGEIRDAETAQSAVQASLTGHLVLSTLHTNDAPSAFARLIDMGIEPYLAASVVEGVLAQRLVRKLCSRCKRSYRPSFDELPADLPCPHDATFFEAVSCRHCHQTGYSGRTAIFELLCTDSTVRQLCTRSASTGELRDYALKSGMHTLKQNGWQRVLSGETTIDEVLRVCAD